MILSKNGKSFISISHKKPLTKIVTAPHTKIQKSMTIEGPDAIRGLALGSPQT